jgi:hypothetical protein
MSLQLAAVQASSIVNRATHDSRSATEGNAGKLSFLVYAANASELGQLRYERGSLLCFLLYFPARIHTQRLLSQRRKR